jgi:hypothetical protein
MIAELSQNLRRRFSRKEEIRLTTADYADFTDDCRIESKSQEEIQPKRGDETDNRNQ